MALKATGGGAPSQTVPQQRIAEKLDDYMSRRDYASAERHLLYWLAEAKALGDARGELMVRNELVGHFRKTGGRDQMLSHAQEALRLVDEAGFCNTISAGTTYTNIATAFNAFGMNDRSLELFRKAAELYEDSVHTDPRLLGGLYNNMALACVALGRFDEADALYAKALGTMSEVENGELEQAITYLNMADAAVARKSSELDANAGSDSTSPQRHDESLRALEDPACDAAVERCLDTALELLNTPSVPRNGYYAFVCEKCAPTFARYGYFLADEDLKKKAAEIYELHEGN